MSEGEIQETEDLDGPVPTESRESLVLGEILDGLRSRKNDGFSPHDTANTKSSRTKHGPRSPLVKFIQGLLSCLRPIWIMIGKATHFKKSAKRADAKWLIPVEEISDLHWLGQGAQGAVFWGIYRNEEVAVKKVAHRKDTDIIRLKKLDHPNIVKFRSVLACSKVPAQ